MTKNGESKPVIFTLIFAIVAFLFFMSLIVYVANQSDRGPSLYEDSKLIRDGPL
jgi:hypothetical protein